MTNDRSIFQPAPLLIILLALPGCIPPPDVPEISNPPSEVEIEPVYRIVETSAADPDIPQYNPNDESEYWDALLESDGTAGENELRYGAIGECSRLNPVLIQDTPSSLVCSLVFDSLYSVDNNLEIIPVLADGMPFLTGDGLQYSVGIRDDVFFHDGEQLTAEDVLFTYNTILDPRKNVDGLRVSDFRDLETVEMLDDFHLLFRLREPYAPIFHHMLNVGILPAHVFESDNAAFIHSTFNRNPVGSGPYRFVEWSVGEFILLERNMEYWRSDEIDGPNIENFRMIFFDTIERAQDALDSSKTDISAIDTTLEGLQIAASEDIHLYQSGTLGFVYLGFNFSRTFFTDIRVRRALSHALDRDHICDEIFGGHAVPQWAQIPPVSPYFTCDVSTWDFNLTASQTLLEEAGWIDRDEDGTIENPDGAPFEFELITNTGHESREKIATYAAEQFSRLGINVEVNTIDWMDLMPSRIESGDYDACVLSFTVGVDPDDFSIFHSSGTQDGFNYGGYSDERVDELLEAGQRELNPEARLAIYTELQQVLSSDLPVLFLVNRIGLQGIQRRFEGPPTFACPLPTTFTQPTWMPTWNVKGYQP